MIKNLLGKGVGDFAYQQESARLRVESRVVVHTAAETRT